MRDSRQEQEANVSDKSQNLQDLFLNAVRRNKTPVTKFLVKGVKLQGIITWFDNFSLLLRRDGQSQLVYKHAIRSEEHTSELQSLMRISYAVFCLKKKTKTK